MGEHNVCRDAKECTEEYGEPWLAQDGRENAGNTDQGKV